MKYIKHEHNLLNINNSSVTIDDYHPNIGVSKNMTIFIGDPNDPDKFEFHLLMTTKDLEDNKINTEEKLNEIKDYLINYIIDALQDDMLPVVVIDIDEALTTYLIKNRENEIKPRTVGNKNDK